MLNISSNVQLIILAEVSFVVVPVVTASITALVGRQVTRQMINNFGTKSQLFLGGLGVVIHELAHALFVVIFGHHLTKLKLLDLSYQESGNLGSVENSWDRRKVWQSLGNFFIGIAPYYAGSLILAGLQSWLLQDPLEFSNFTNVSSWSEVWYESKSLIGNDFAALFSARWWAVLLYLALLLMISITVYNLSGADLKTVIRGLFPWSLVVLVIAGILLVLQQQDLILNWSLKFTLASILFMLRGLLYLALGMLLLLPFSLRKQRISSKHF